MNINIKTGKFYISYKLIHQEKSNSEIEEKEAHSLESKEHGHGEEEYCARCTRGGKR